MTIESVSYITGFDITLPDGGDAKSEGDNHIRNIKDALKTTFPLFSSAVSASPGNLNYLIGLDRTAVDSFNNISASLSNLDSRVSTISASLSAVITLVDAHSASISNLNSRVSTLSASLSALITSTTNLADAISQSLSQIHSLLSAGLVNKNKFIARAYKSSIQIISASLSATITFDTELFDQNGGLNGALGRFTPDVSGYYRLNYKGQITYDAVSSSYGVKLLLNSTIVNSDIGINIDRILYITANSSIALVLDNKTTGSNFTVGAGELTTYIEINGPL